MPHLPIHPTLPHATYFISPNEKKHKWKGGFANVAEVKEKTTEALSEITDCDFKKCFEQWNKRWTLLVPFESTLKEIDGFLFKSLMLYNFKYYWKMFLTWFKVLVFGQFTLASLSIPTTLLESVYLIYSDWLIAYLMINCVQNN